jgi:DNA-directed RNA polymerase sigma subunit (sigma70/sigma32)
MSDDNNEFTTEELTDLKESTKEILLNLTAREAKILRSRFGIDFSKDNNLDDLGRQFDVTRKRIQEIEEKALKKLKATKEKVQNCSFCGKSINEVKRMIVSEINNVFICNECIKNCGDLLDE